MSLLSAAIPTGHAQAPTLAERQRTLTPTKTMAFATAREIIAKRGGAMAYTSSVLQVLVEGYLRRTFLSERLSNRWNFGALSFWVGCALTR